MHGLSSALGAMAANVSTALAPAEPSLPLVLHTALTSLDDRVVAALLRGDILLLRATWLRNQGVDFRIVMRQALEQQGASPSPLLRPEEAVALMRKGSRGIGVLSYGWPTPGNPDPTGHRVEVVKRTLAENLHIEAVFWVSSRIERIPTLLAAADRQCHRFTNTGFRFPVPSPT